MFASVIMRSISAFQKFCYSNYGSYKDILFKYYDNLLTIICFSNSPYLDPRPQGHGKFIKNLVFYNNPANNYLL